MTQTTGTDWQAWQDSWDRQQEWYMPDREERFRVMLEMTEALTGPRPAVLDLACGTGTITDRLLKRLPEARSTGVDLDPALLTIARGHFAGEERAEFVTADITDPEWAAKLPHRRYDAVLTATALHWLDPGQLRTLYGQIGQIVREGGVFLNADHMTDESAPRINAAAAALTDTRKKREQAAGVQDWAAWWSEVAEDPALAGAAQQRFALFDDPRTSATARIPREKPSTGWHLETLRASGFAEARQVWCSASDAVVCGLR